jgi:hypothetical protein
VAEFMPVVHIFKVTSCHCSLKLFLVLSVDGQLQEVTLFKHVYLDHSIHTDGLTVWPARFSDLTLLDLSICKTKLFFAKSTDFKEFEFHIHGAALFISVAVCSQN